VPLWLRTAYANPTQHRHVLGSNQGYSIPEMPKYDVGKFLADQGKAFAALSCSDFHGGEGSADGVSAVGQLKAGLTQTTQVCPRAPYPAMTAKVDGNALYDAWAGTGLFDTSSIPVACAARGRYPMQFHSYMPGAPISWLDNNFVLTRGCLAQPDIFPEASGCVYPSSPNTRAEQCIVDDLYPPNPLNPHDKYALYTRRMLLPRSCGPDNRVLAAVNSYPPIGPCSAASQLAQAVALACELSFGDMFPPMLEPPEINSIEQLPGFKRWIDRQNRIASAILRQIILEDVPQKVVDDIRSQTVGYGGVHGEHGRIVMQTETSLRAIVSNWNKVQSDLTQLGIAFDSVTNALVAARINEDQELAQLAIQRMQVHIQMTQAILTAVTNMTTNVSGTKYETAARVVGNMAALAVILANSVGQLDALSDLGHLAGEEKANQMEQALIHLRQTAEPLYADVAASLIAVQSAAADTLVQISQMRQAEARAKYEVAKGLGQDYVVIGDQVQEFPVNTVLRREHDITRLRYERALKEARYLAFMARLAIEQRIGARMGSLSQSIGPLEPPAQWADDVCTLQGVNYERLKKAYDPDKESGPSDVEEEAIVAEFADQYIGDYVAKLENFVDYYNIEYPSHDGDDLAVLSLREDLLAATGSCTRTSPNLLLYSSHLEQSDAALQNDFPVPRGWRINPCQPGLDRCLRINPGDALPSVYETANSPPAVQLGGGVT
jgi:hypothetical protein